MTHPLEIAGSVELAVVERSGLDESRHLGAAAVVDGDGDLILSIGDPTATIWPRSALKPLQALSVRRGGLALDPVATVLSAASHAGTPAHTAEVLRMLEEAGLDEQALRCPPAFPLDPASARGVPAPTRIAHNCSGKHAAFLAASVSTGADAARYLDPADPVQRRVRDTVEELAGERVARVGVDGCGAPLLATTIVGLARGLAGFVRDPDGAAITASILAEPWALDGPGRANTVIIEECGVVAKGGAEGVLVLAALDGTAVAVKVLDGSARATALVGLVLLAAAGALDPETASRAASLVTERVIGGEAAVGRIRNGAGLAEVAGVSDLTGG